MIKFLSQNIVLSTVMKNNKTAQISVSGISMEPILKSGDSITIKREDNYDVGDILVFIYKEELLVHRLIKKDSKYYCKGDNAFRLEDITKEQILGKIILVNEKNIDPWPAWQIELSYLVNRVFRKCGYNIEETKKSSIYKLYNEMVFNKNIFLQEGLDGKDGQLTKTYFAANGTENAKLYEFNEFEESLINILQTPSTIQGLISHAQRSKNIPQNDIYDMIGKFLLYAVSNNIIVAI